MVSVKFLDFNSAFAYLSLSKLSRLATLQGCKDTEKQYEYLEFFNKSDLKSFSLHNDSCSILGRPIFGPGLLLDTMSICFSDSGFLCLIPRLCS